MARTTVRLLVVLTMTSLWCNCVYSADTSATGALISFPFEFEDGNLFNVSWRVAPAQFGYQQYGGSLDAFLVIPMKTRYHLECDAGEPKYLNASSSTRNSSTNQNQSDSDSDGMLELANPYIHRIHDWDVSQTDITQFIFMIDRGTCYFVDKIENAQALGASAVIICDKTDEALFTMWMPEDWVDTIDIPSVLLRESHCEILMKHLGVQNWNPTNIAQTSYPTSVDEYNWTIARLEWGLPHDDDRVEWELWTSSNDEDAIAFKNEFRDTSNILDAQNDTIFTPHLYVLDGSHWSCNTKSLPCGQQCSNNGRYCAVDPEFDTSIGLDGIDVVQENLRSICVWEFDKNYSHVNNNTLWWDYSSLWDTQCFLPDITNPQTTFNANCSYTQMKAVHRQPYNVGEPRLHEFVQLCVNESGGYAYKGGKNSLLAAESKSRTDSSIYALPMVRVNEFLIHGSLDCSVVTIQECTVLAAICAGFTNGTKPAVCYNTPAPTMPTCDDSLKDCNGTCFGEYVYDKCEACLLESDVTFDACVGCDGVAFSGKIFNPCGECFNETSPEFDTFGQDCAAICFGSSVNDKCGQCLLPSDALFDACVGCDNIANSNYRFNPCGYCISDSTPNFETYGTDCNQTCNGDSHIDDCGQCLLLNSHKFNACKQNNATKIIQNDVTSVRVKKSSSKTDKVLVTVVICISVIAFFIIIFACLIIAGLWKKQTTITNRFNSLASTYQIMDDLPQAQTIPGIGDDEMGMEDEVEVEVEYTQDNISNEDVIGEDVLQN